jgi:S-adenosylmethionine hydrolase
MGREMKGLDIITFLSDFGRDGGYVAACEAVVASVQPQARVLHISHEVAVGDVAAGALILERVAPLCPSAVHLAVIDPGVGTERRPLVLRTTRGDVLVGPDNGLLPPAADALGGLSGAWMLDPSRVRSRAGLCGNCVSSTFHGRDLFAPAAALLSAAVDPNEYGSTVDSTTLVRLPPTTWQVTPREARAEVIEIDRFGNVGLALRFDDFFPREGTLIVDVEGEALPEWSARVVQTFGELGMGELGVFRDSWGQVALALNAASAAQLLSVERGMIVRLTRAEAGS